MKEALAQAQLEEQQQAEADAQEKKNAATAEVKPPSVSISFKDLPPAGKIQAAAKYGIQLMSEDVMRAMDDGADAENKTESAGEAPNV